MNIIKTNIPITLQFRTNIKMNKVIIEDLVSQHNGKGEKELDADQAIRFENDDFKYTVGWDKATNKLSIYKIAKGFDNSIKISPQSCNQITIV